jgi:hypothetical protein
LSKEFELARLQMIRAARAGDVDQGRGYAWAHRIFPFNPRNLEEIFESDFKISRKAVDDVVRAIADGWRSKKYVQFYDLEGKFQSLDRMEIYHICRLAFLEDSFDSKVWKALTENGSGPVETQGMCEPFKLDYDIEY